MLEDWRARLLREGKGRRTCEKCMIACHGILVRARWVWGLAHNAAADVEPLPAKYSGDYDFYSPEEVRAPVRAAEDEQVAAIVMTAAFTGMRMGELLALRWQDVDFDGEAIRVRASYSYGAETTPKSGKVRAVPMVPDVAQALARPASPACASASSARSPGATSTSTPARSRSLAQMTPDGAVKTPKTAAGIRVVPILPALRRVLVQWRLRSPHTRPDDLVVCTADGGPVQERNVRRALDDAKAAAGHADTAGRLSTHALRHSCLSALATGGLAATTLAELAGHTDPGFTLRVYARDGRDPAELVADVLARAAGAGFAR